MTLLIGPQQVLMGNPFGKYIWHSFQRLVIYRDRQSNIIQIVQLPKGKNTEIDALALSVDHMLDTVLQRGRYDGAFRAMPSTPK